MMLFLLISIRANRKGISQGWVQLHKITSITITITLKYQLQLQLQLHLNSVILKYNYNYDMFISVTITITVQFLRKLHLYLWKCVLINMGCFPFLGCCLVTLPLSLAMLFGSIILQHLISHHVWDNCIRSYQVKRQNMDVFLLHRAHSIGTAELSFVVIKKLQIMKVIHLW